MASALLMPKVKVTLDATLVVDTKSKNDLFLMAQNQFPSFQDTGWNLPHAPMLFAVGESLFFLSDSFGKTKKCMERH